MSKTIEHIREKIAPLAAARDALVTRPTSREELAAEIRAELQARFEAARGTLATRLTLRAGGRQDVRIVDIPIYSGADLSKAILETVVAAAGVKQLESTCAELIRDLPIPSTKAERLRRVAELTRELDVLELDEERQIAAAEREGHWIMRRPDARAEIVLSCD